MKKYWIFTTITISEYMAYRMNFFMWRVRQIIQLLVMYFLWFAVFANQNVLFGYTESMMLSYVFLTALLHTYVLGTTTNGLGEMINDGRLTNFLTRPIGFFKVFMARDAADKFLNLICSVVEIAVLILILRPSLSIQHDPMLLILTLITTGIAIVLFFYFSLIIGFLGFWTPEIWGPRFLSIIIVEFFSGAMFPLDVFPGMVKTLSLYLPFQYLLYFPASIYLGKLEMPAIFFGICVSIGWTVGLYLAATIIWHRGLAVYEAQGR